MVSFFFIWVCSYYVIFLYHWKVASSSSVCLFVLQKTPQAASAFIFCNSFLASSIFLSLWAWILPFVTSVDVLNHALPYVFVIFVWDLISSRNFFSHAKSSSPVFFSCLSKGLQVEQRRTSLHAEACRLFPCEEDVRVLMPT